MCGVLLNLMTMGSERVRCYVLSSNALRCATRVLNCLRFTEAEYARFRSSSFLPLLFAPSVLPVLLPPHPLRRPLGRWSTRLP